MCSWAEHHLICTCTLSIPEPNAHKLKQSCGPDLWFLCPLYQNNQLDMVENSIMQELNRVTWHWQPLDDLAAMARDICETYTTPAWSEHRWIVWNLARGWWTGWNWCWIWIELIVLVLIVWSQLLSCLRSGVPLRVYRTPCPAHLASLFMFSEYFGRANKQQQSGWFRENIPFTRHIIPWIRKTFSVYPIAARCPIHPQRSTPTSLESPA